MLPMASNTSLIVLRDAAGNAVKTVVNSLSEFGEYFFRQCLSLNPEKSLHEENTRYRKSAYYRRNLNKRN